MYFLFKNKYIFVQTTSKKVITVKPTSAQNQIGGKTIISNGDNSRITSVSDSPIENNDSPTENDASSNSPTDATITSQTTSMRKIFNNFNFLKTGHSKN